MFIPKDPAGRYHTIEWVMFQMANIGPMLARRIISAARRPPHRVRREALHRRGHALWKVMDGRLGEVPYLAGNDYTIADIATYVWLRNPKGQGRTSTTI